MKGPRVTEQELELVRCLDCGTAYELPLAQEAAAPCPSCGGVGWIVLDVARRRDPETST